MMELWNDEIVGNRKTVGFTKVQVIEKTGHRKPKGILE
jgi:hypothetical protein